MRLGPAVPRARLFAYLSYFLRLHVDMTTCTVMFFTLCSSDGFVGIFIALIQLIEVCRCVFTVNSELLQQQLLFFRWWRSAAVLGSSSCCGPSFS